MSEWNRANYGPHMRPSQQPEQPRRDSDPILVLRLKKRHFLWLVGIITAAFGTGAGGLLKSFAVEDAAETAQKKTVETKEEVSDATKKNYDTLAKAIEQLAENDAAQSERINGTIEELGNIRDAIEEMSDKPAVRAYRKRQKKLPTPVTTSKPVLPPAEVVTDKPKEKGEQEPSPDAQPEE